VAGERRDGRDAFYFMDPTLADTLSATSVAATPQLSWRVAHTAAAQWACASHQQVGTAEKLITAWRKV
jgi:hypothetical protein